MSALAPLKVEVAARQQRREHLNVTRYRCRFPAGPGSSTLTF